MSKRLYVYAIIALLILVVIQSITLAITAYDKAMYENVFEQASQMNRKTQSKAPSWFKDDSRPGTAITKASGLPPNFKAFAGQGRTLV
jgi:sortase (surface protein transpeptidase)